MIRKAMNNQVNGLIWSLKKIKPTRIDPTALIPVQIGYASERSSRFKDNAKNKKLSTNPIIVAIDHHKCEKPLLNFIVVDHTHSNKPAKIKYTHCITNSSL